MTITIRPEEIKILKQAITTWGAALQQIVAIEEMAELTKELCKLRRNSIGPKNYSAVIDEIADVQIMIWQLAEMFGSDNVQSRVEKKIYSLAIILRDKEDK